MADDEVYRHRLLRHQEQEDKVGEDAGEDEDLEMMTSPFLHHHEGNVNANDEHPQYWPRTRSGRWSRTSFKRLFGSPRSIFYPLSARASLVLSLLTLLLVFAFWTTIKTSLLSPATDTAKDNAMFKEVIEFERALPQHNPDLPFPEGRKGRYINFSGHAWGSGWNNVLQEQLMTAHLALLARRAYVFPPHIARDHRPFNDIANLVIPFSTFTYGPITGAPFAWSRGSASESSLTEDEIIPRAVSEEYFHSVCSEEQTIVLSVEEVSRELGIDVDGGNTLTNMIAWGKRLAEMEQPCVDIRGRAVFLYTLFGSPKLLPVWSILESSPIYKAWDWSPLIHSTLEANGISPPSNSISALVRKSLPSTHPWAWKTPLKRSTASPEGLSAEPLEGRTTDSAPYILNKLVAVHVRRGDYEGHCQFLASIGVLWNSWNAFGIYSREHDTIPARFSPEDFHIEPHWANFNATYPKLPDSIFDAPYSTAYPHDTEGKVDPTTLTREQLLHLHCWVRLDGIRDKLAAVRRGHPGLEEVYLMTNGEDRWVGALRELLLEDGWKSVRSSKELVLSDAAHAASPAVDMAIGNWAEVFIGNGYSSLSSNVVAFRLAQGYPPGSNYLF